MTPLEKARAGLPVTLSDKLARVESLAELEGFKARLIADGRLTDPHDQAAVARRAVELRKGR